MSKIEAVFFDLGDTLGVPVSENGRLERFDVFGFTKPLLEKLSKRGLRLGVISNTGDERGERLNELLEQAGIFEEFTPGLLIYSADVGSDKQTVEIFNKAVEKAAPLAAAECLFVGEDPQERTTANSAGLAVCPHPLLVEELIEGDALDDPRLENREDDDNDDG